MDSIECFWEAGGGGAILPDVRAKNGSKEEGAGKAGGECFRLTGWRAWLGEGRVPRSGRGICEQPGPHPSQWKRPVSRLGRAESRWGGRWAHDIQGPIIRSITVSVAVETMLKEKGVGQWCMLLKRMTLTLEA